MGLILRKTICYLCAIICACSLALAEGQKTMAFVPTGKNSYQNGTAQLLFTTKGTLFSFTKKFLPFAAYDPQKIYKDSLSFFLTYKDGRYTHFNIGAKSYKLNDLTIIKSNVAIKIQKALAFILLSDGTLVIVTNGKFVAHLVDKELIKIFFNASEERTYGVYEIKDGGLLFGKTLVDLDKLIGVGQRGYEPTECANKNILKEEELTELKKLAQNSAKRFLANLIAKKQERDWYLQSIWWMAPGVGLDLANLVMVKLETDGTACIFTEESLK
jgi:hypothetical protein